MTASEEIDDYLAGLPDDQRDVLQHLRAFVGSLVPEAEEAISYGVPAFKYRKRPLIGYSASSSHVSLFPMSPAVIDDQRQRLEAWSTSKGTIRFTADHPLPDDLVASLVKARIAELDPS